MAVGRKAAVRRIPRGKEAVSKLREMGVTPHESKTVGKFLDRLSSAGLTASQIHTAIEAFTELMRTADA